MLVTQYCVRDGPNKHNEISVVKPGPNSIKFSTCVTAQKGYFSPKYRQGDPVRGTYNSPCVGQRSDSAFNVYCCHPGWSKPCELNTSG